MKEYNLIGRMEEVLSKLKGKRNTEVYEYLDDFITVLGRTLPLLQAVR